MGKRGSNRVHRIMTKTVVIDSFSTKEWFRGRGLSVFSSHLDYCNWLREHSRWPPPYEVCREYLTYSMRGLRQLKGAIKTYEAQMGGDGSDDDEDQFNWLHPDYLALHTALQHERQHQRNITPDLRYEGSVDPLDPDSVICLF